MKFIHGHRPGKGKPTKEYRCWANMKDRCNNPGDTVYHNYGGRGIKVCERWMHSYPNFLADMGYAPSPKHTLDRIDNDGNYEPSNCRWLTRSEQMRNTRKNRILQFNGETKTVAEWVEITGIRRATIMSRLRLGWTIDKTLTEPVKNQIEDVREFV